MKYSEVIVRSQIALILGLMPTLSLADLANCSVTGSTNTCSGNYSVYDQSHLNYDNVVINTTGDAVDSPEPEGYGVYVNSPLLAQKNLTVTTDGQDADGIVTSGTGSLTVNGKLYVNVTGSSADGIHAIDASNSSIIIGNEAEIYSAGGAAVRADLSRAAGESNLITIGDNAIIKSTAYYGNNNNDVVGYAVFAGNRNSENIPGAPEGTAKIVIGDNSDIATTGSYASAVYANKGGIIQLGSTKVTTQGEASHGILAESGGVTDNNMVSHYLGGGKVELLGDTTINVTNPNPDPTFGNPSYAIYSTGKDALVASYNSDTGKDTSGVFKVNGDMLVNDGGKIDLRMTNGSEFIGNTYFDGSDGVLNLNIAGATSYWEMSQNSKVTDLALSDNAQVRLGNQSVSVNPTNKIKLTVENLSGNGNFLMRSDVANNIGDLLTVEGTSAGKHGVTVKDAASGSSAVDGTERLLLVQTSDGKAEFYTANTNGYVDIGAYQYSIVKGDASKGEDKKNWYLGVNSSPGQGGNLTNTADRSVNVLNINYLLNYVETQTLLQRMGELRESRDNDWDFWTRGFAGRLSSFSSKLSGFDMDYHGFQAGLDRRFAINNNDLYLGVMAGTAKANADYDIGHGDTRSYHVGVYGTYKTQNDFYLDAIAKYVVMKNDFNTETGGGYKVDGNGTTRGYTLGLETGKRFYFNSVKTGWYIEPQAQLTYSHQNSANIHSSNGLKTNLDDFDSILGRASAIVGYSIKQGNTPVNVYLKTGYVKEFDGKTSYTFNDNGNTKTKYNFDSSWWDNGIGINAQINKKHNVYLEADYATGNRFDNKSIKVGYRLAF